MMGLLINKVPGTYWTGGWVGSRLGLDAVEKRKSLASAGNLTQAVQPSPVAIMSSKWCGRKRLCPNLMQYSDICPDRLRETTRTFRIPGPRIDTSIWDSWTQSRPEQTCYPLGIDFHMKFYKTELVSYVAPQHSLQNVLCVGTGFVTVRTYSHVTI
jgi:hypothetical protein